MGPGSFDPGNSSAAKSRQRKTCSLQWGRGLSTPEIRSGKKSRHYAGCFNGAGVFRPRKWREITRPKRASGGFNGAGVFRPRKSQAQPCRAPTSICFNGAGVFRPRKLHICGFARAMKAASMGPGSFDPGKPAAAQRIADAALGFNGAGVFRPRKSWSTTRSWGCRTSFNGAGVFRPRKMIEMPTLIAMDTLQWGRGLSTPENDRQERRIAVTPTASMGPGSFDPGNRWLGASPRRYCPLQWGRGLSTPETGGHGQPPRRPMRLQWGRGLSTPENSIRSSTNFSRRRFNGAGVFRPRKIRPVEHRQRQHIASMGPGSFDPGKCANRGLRVRKTRASMGPGSFDPGKKYYETDKGWMPRLQWGRGLSTPETTTTPPSSSSTARFNGAGVFRPRKRRLRAGRVSQHPASMGPGSFDPGKAQRRVEIGDQTRASMGPGSFDPGKVMVARGTAVHALLQWGRGLSTPERVRRG